MAISLESLSLLVRIDMLTPLFLVEFPRQKWSRLLHMTCCASICMYCLRINHIGNTLMHLTIEIISWASHFFWPNIYSIKSTEGTCASSSLTQQVPTWFEERLWTTIEKLARNTSVVAPRLARFRCLLNQRGVAAAPLFGYGRSAPSDPGSCINQ